MSIPNFKDYMINQHSKERILTRFGITAKNVDKWLGRLMQEAKYDSKQKGNGRLRYRWEDIVIVVDPKQHEVVTVFSEDKDQIPVAVNKRQLNPELKIELDKCLDNFIKRKEQRVALMIGANGASIANHSEKIKKSRTSSKNVENHYSEIVKSYHAMDVEITKAEAMIEEAELVRSDFL